MKWPRRRYAIRTRAMALDGTQVNTIGTARYWTRSGAQMVANDRAQSLPQGLEPLVRFSVERIPDRTEGKS